jgi:hypothetical protein
MSLINRLYYIDQTINELANGSPLILVKTIVPIAFANPPHITNRYKLRSFKARTYNPLKQCHPRKNTLFSQEYLLIFENTHNNN